MTPKSFVEFCAVKLRKNPFMCYLTYIDRQTDRQTAGLTLELTDRRLETFMKYSTEMRGCLSSGQVFTSHFGLCKKYI
jgi:hypothetical protein